MRVAIIGAPGAGKTSFANRMAKDLKTNFKVSVIDNVVQNLTKKTGYAYGMWATYPQNYQILFDRWTKEQEAEHKGADIVISVGSMYEAILWAATYSTQLVFRNDYIAQVEAKSALTTLGMMEDLLHPEIDLLFYLPYTSKQREIAGKSYDALIDQKLPEVIAGYAHHSPLTIDTKKEKVKYAADLTRQAFAKAETETSEDERQAVPGSGATTLDRSQAEESVPNMWR